MTLGKRLGQLILGGCRKCWQWRFYVLGALVFNLFLLFLWITETPGEFVRASSEISTWGIVGTLVFKAIVLAVMTMTVPKTQLDRRWIWHTWGLEFLFAYALIATRFPGIIGSPELPRFIVEDPNDRQIVAAIVLFNIWGEIMWSALGVLLSLWDERGRFVYFRLQRQLRNRNGYAP